MTGSPFRQTAEHIKLFIEITKEGCDHMFNRITKEYIKIVYNYFEITRDNPGMTPPSLINIFHALANINPMVAEEYYEEVKDEILESLERTMDDENNRGAYNCGEWGKALRTDVYEMIELCKLICVRRYGEGNLERRYAKHKKYVERREREEVVKCLREEGIISTDDIVIMRK